MWMKFSKLWRVIYLAEFLAKILALFFQEESNCEKILEIKERYKIDTIITPKTNCTIPGERNI